MSSFQVVPTSLSDAGVSLSGISTEVAAAQSVILGTSGAAAGTSAAAAFEDALSQFAAVMPHYAAVGAALSGSLSAAGAAYVTVDETIAAGCDSAIADHDSATH